MRKTLTVAGTLVLVLASLIAVSHAAPLPPGTTAPDFTLDDIHGNSYTLSAQLGKVVMIEFFFTT